jgi:cation/acetate symporter
MVSTTWVQFLKGGLLVIFCTVLVALVLQRGFNVTPLPTGGEPMTRFGTVSRLPNGVERSGPLGPISYLSTFAQSTITKWTKHESINEVTGAKTISYAPLEQQGSDLLLPGASPTFKGVRSPDLSKKLDFLSLMIALFLGTASLPHILIRYYTVKDAAAARKSTVVGIAAIGAFYVLTLYLGLGAMTSGNLDPTDSNMSAPLLARSFSETLFAVISAIAFTTVLGTVSGLVMAGAGAVAHDLFANVFGIMRDDRAKVRCAKVTAIALGAGAMILGVLFERMNVTFLVGWAFNIAASANLPSLIMVLFWRRTTKQGVIAAIFVGMASSLAWILLSADTIEKVYGFAAADATASAIVPFSQPGLVTIPLGFVTLVVVSLLTGRKLAASR